LTTTWPLVLRRGSCVVLKLADLSAKPVIRTSL
jgi:hypothetical protein